MDLPILKHLDVLIGLAVVMLIMATVVVAITQFILSCRSARSLYLRERLTELVSQIAPKLESSEAEYVAERILRHPLIGRQRWLRAPWPAAPVSPEPERTVVEADWPLWWRRRRELKLPLPAVARGEVVLRQEIVVALLEWAAGEGPLTMQDRTLTAEKPEARERMEQLVGKLREALLAAGVADAAQAASAMSGRTWWNLKARTRSRRRRCGTRKRWFAADWGTSPAGYSRGMTRRWTG